MFRQNRVEIRLDHARVELTRGQWAVIDVADVPVIEPFRWNAIPNVMGGFYATAKAQGPERARLMPMALENA